MPMKFGDGVRAPTPSAPPRARTRRRRFQPAQAAVAALAVASAATMICSGAAKAGTMVYNACADAHGPTSMTGAGWRVDNYGPWTGGTSQGASHNECATSGRFLLTLGSDARTNAGVGLALTYSAPPATRIAGFSIAALRSRSIWAGPSAYLVRGWHDGNGQSANVFWGPVPEPGAPHDYAGGFQVQAVDWGSMTWILECTPNLGGSYCDASSTPTLAMGGIQIVLRDDSAPSVTATHGSLPATGTVSGTKTVGYNVTDAGVGAHTTQLYIDGQLQHRQTIDENGGSCVSRAGGFPRPVPCKLTASDTVSINTAALRDGEHTFRIVTEDAAGNRTTVAERTLTTANAPQNTTPPRVSNARSPPRVGDVLSAEVGTWERSPRSYERRWLACPPSGALSECEPIAGADGPTHTITSADAYKRIVAAVAATNDAGTSSWSQSAPIGPIADEDGAVDPAPANRAGPGWITPATSPRVGDRLSVNPGAWTGRSLAFTVTFRRCTGDRCVRVTSGPSTTYTVTTDDLGSQLVAEVTATNPHGSAARTTDATGIVRAADDATGRDIPNKPDDPPGKTPDPPTPPAPNWPIDGLTNPLAGRGHTPNGSGASENARIRVALTARRGKRTITRTSLRTTRSRRPVMTGTLRNADGRAIGGAKVVIAAQQPGRRWRAVGLVTTTTSGAFRYTAAPGSSRSLKAIYFAFGDSVQYAESNAATVLVATPVRLRVTPRATSNGRTVRFAGTVGRDGLPRAGVLVTLEARYPGGKWKQFKVVRTTKTGRLAATYRFTSTSARTRYQFRARVAKQAAYPFEGGISKPVPVTVRPR